MATTKKTSAKTNRGGSKTTAARTARKTTSRAAAKTPAKKTTSRTAAKATAKASVTTAAPSPRQATTGRIGMRTVNLIAAVLLLAQAIAIAVLSSSSFGSRGLTNSYLVLDQLQTKAGGSPVYVQGTSHVIDLNMAYVVAAFLGVAGMFYLVSAIWYRRRYEQQQAQRRSLMRWLGYATAGSGLMVALGMANGIFDVVSLLMLVGLTVAVAIFGYVVEVSRADNLRAAVPRWAVYTIAAATSVVSWLAIGATLKGTIIDGNAPHYLYWLDGSAFVLAVLLVVNFYLSLNLRGRWRDFQFGERLFTILAFVLYSAVAWQLFVGVLHR